MSILVRFTPTSLTAERYEEASRRVGEALGWPPEGLDIHVCFGEEGSLQVSEVWDSREQFEAVRERLLGAVGEAGVEFSAEPEIFEIHNIARR